MPTLKKYKKMENAFYAKASARLTASGGRFRAFLARVGVAGRQKLTIMLIPHTEKKIINLQLSFFAMAGLIAAAAIVLFAFVFSAARFSDTARRLQNRSDDLKSTQADLDSIRDETSRLVTAAKRFETSLSGTLARIGAQSSAPDSQVQQGDLASFF
ncbi:MAG TPA: hypothetical protein VFL04_05770, partial [Rectinemataceae bacterium]|nr:hypothetical protein [Rectinemataceae bacterium]